MPSSAKIKVTHILTDSNIGGAGRLLRYFLEKADREHFEYSVILPEDAALIPEIEAQILEAKAIAEANSNKASKSELQAVADRVTALEKKMANITDAVESILKTLKDNENNKPMSAAYDTVRMTYGQKLFSQENSFEIILRVGEAEVISPFTYENGSEYVQGIADITAGVDVTDGSAIEKNHMLVVPCGGDGRGILCTSEYAYILVRGEYYIVD